MPEMAAPTVAQAAVPTSGGARDRGAGGAADGEPSREEARDGGAKAVSAGHGRVVHDLAAFVQEQAYETDTVSVCGLELVLTRKRSDYFAASAGDLPIEATGVVLWECGLLLADYLGYARWIESSKAAQCGAAAAARPWWMINPPAAVVPSRFWSSADRGLVLELGGGCGLVASVLASLGARVLSTDGDVAAVRTAERNCQTARKRCEARQASGAGGGRWGSVDLRQLGWGDKAEVEALLERSGQLGLVIGSDLLYGSSNTPGPLLETLAALATDPRGRDAEVILALKSRCCDEVARFRAAAEALGLWTLRVASPDDFPEGYDLLYSADGGETTRAYNIVHMVVRESIRAGTEDARDRDVTAALASVPKRQRLGA